MYFYALEIYKDKYIVINYLYLTIFNSLFRKSDAAASCIRVPLL